MATNYLEIEQEKQRAVTSFYSRTAKRPGKMGKTQHKAGFLARVVHSVLAVQ